MVDTNISAYNWLCSTMPKKDAWTCYNDDTGNMVTDDEGKQAENRRKDTVIHHKTAERTTGRSERHNGRAHTEQHTGSQGPAVRQDMISILTGYQGG